MALNHAIRIAEAHLTTIDEIKQRARDVKIQDAAAARSDIPALLELNTSN